MEQLCGDWFLCPPNVELRFLYAAFCFCAQPPYYTPFRRAGYNNNNNNNDYDDVNNNNNDMQLSHSWINDGILGQALQ
jgi:hypothetical protein